MDFSVVSSLPTAFPHNNTSPTSAVTDPTSSRRNLRKSKSYAANLRDFVSGGFEDLFSLHRSADRGDAAPRKSRRDLEYERNLRRGRILRATTYDEYRAAAAELDELDGVEEWKAEDESDLYDFRLLSEKVREMEDVLRTRDVERVLEALRTYTGQNFAGLRHPGLYTRSRLGTKDLVERYVAVVREMVAFLVQANGHGDTERILAAMKLLRRQCGRTALLLSGGGTLGMNHIGVVKALFETGLLPQVISGTSAGSIVAAVLCTRSDEDVTNSLQDFLHGDLAVFVGPDEAAGRLARIKYFMEHRFLYDVSNLRRVTQHWLGDLTFAEAYKRSNRVLNIAVSTTGGSRGPLLLNVYSTPHVVIRSAVVASCSVPFIFESARLEFKSPTTGEIGIFRDDETYMDGSLQGDIPAQDVSDQLGCDAFIVSQVNPHIRPWIREVDPHATLPTRLYSVCSDYLWSEAAHHFDYLQQVIPRPKIVDDWCRIAGQPYVGDINILPAIEHQRVYGVLSNPTPEFMEFAQLNGERAAWKKMNQIHYTVAVEKTFDDAIQTLQARLDLPMRMSNLRLRLPDELPSSAHTLFGHAHHDNDVSETSTADWLNIKHGRIIYKSSSLPSTPLATTANKKFFDPLPSCPSTPRARSPAQAPLDLIMTPTRQDEEIRRKDLSARETTVTVTGHRRSQSDLSLHVSAAAFRGVGCSPLSQRQMQRGRGRAPRRLSRSRSRSRTPAAATMVTRC